MSGIFDPALFADAAIDAETRARNEALIAAARAAPDRWRFTADELRAARRAGFSPFRLERPSPRAGMLAAPGVGGRPDVPLRVIPPRDGPPRGAYLYIHGGGWMLNSADSQDERLEQLADRTGLVCVSVEYRLAPEHPYPAGPDDCETAALWLTGAGASRFGVERLFIGGESAGAHLAAVTLLRLRDRHGMTPFRGANLVCGAFDLGLTPSMRAQEVPLVLARRDTEAFVARFLQNGEDVRDPDVSPLYGDLAGMPPALFSCGTRDGLLDDTLFMAARWAAAGSQAELSLWPGGAHFFQGIHMPLAERSNREMDEWLKRMCDR
ncbi:alpha/beta hydrolase [Propylenella binzhouense]|uniref:Alpha/beta hydrolase n=1 Tax=Propylenella binzhouense TaxID=2555902 RepID=A0A964WTG9_9HYPH|nr:alpha/beta hydrolase [Propylenella binzhouense]MYZ47989.1 alpha/beta hydrolase [Propylenella binzhouense]